MAVTRSAHQDVNRGALRRIVQETRFDFEDREEAPGFKRALSHGSGMQRLRTPRTGTPITKHNKSGRRSGNESRLPEKAHAITLMSVDAAARLHAHGVPRNAAAEAVQLWIIAHNICPNMRLPGGAWVFSVRNRRDAGSVRILHLSTRPVLYLM